METSQKETVLLKPYVELANCVLHLEIVLAVGGMDPEPIRDCYL